MLRLERLVIIVCFVASFLLGGCYVHTGLIFEPEPILVPVVVIPERPHVHEHYHRRHEPNWNNFCYTCDQYQRGQHFQYR